MKGKDLTPERVVRGYVSGAFPMGRHADADTIDWYRPSWRGVLPLEGFHIARRLAKTLRRGGLQVTCDRAFDAVIAACADRDETWINADITRVFRDLHAMGLAHSVEVWSEGELVGGVYGLALGQAFCAESMFSRRTDASKIALVELVARLRAGGFTLLDTQYLTPHLSRLGGIEISARQYDAALQRALSGTADRDAAFGAGPVSALLAPSASAD